MSYDYLLNHAEKEKTKLYEKKAFICQGLLSQREPPMGAIDRVGGIQDRIDMLSEIATSAKSKTGDISRLYQQAGLEIKFAMNKKLVKTDDEDNSFIKALGPRPRPRPRPEKAPPKPKPRLRTTMLSAPKLPLQLPRTEAPAPAPARAPIPRMRTRVIDPNTASPLRMTKPYVSQTPGLEVSGISLTVPHTGPSALVDIAMAVEYLIRVLGLPREPEPSAKTGLIFWCARHKNHPMVSAIKQKVDEIMPRNSEAARMYPTIYGHVQEHVVVQQRGGGHALDNEFKMEGSVRDGLKNWKSAKVGIVPSPDGPIISIDGVYSEPQSRLSVHSTSENTFMLKLGDRVHTVRLLDADYDLLLSLFSNSK